MTRINVFWQGNGMSCFWTPEGVRRYGEERELLHAYYGGRCYYTSRSGATGAGYLRPKAGDVLIELGYYRVDTGPGPGHQKKRRVGTCSPGNGYWSERPIFAYAPVQNGGNPSGSYPVVLTDGKRIAFVSQWPDAYAEKNLITTVTHWDDLPWDEAKEIAVSFLNWDSREEMVFKLLPNGFYGVNALRFADLREAQDFARAQTEYCASSRWSNILNVGVQGNRIYIFHPLFWYVSDAFTVPSWPEEINGWAIRQDGDNKLFCWRQTSNFEVTSMAVNLESNEEYEEVFSAFAFVPEDAEKELHRKLRHKERKTAIIQKMQSYSENITRRTLQENPLMVITIEDSLRAGNCRFGTEGFLKQFGLKEEYTAQELLEHPRFEGLLRIAAFRKVIAYVRHRPEAEAI